MPEVKYQVFARKYRPQTFGEVIGQESVVTTVKNALRLNRVAHAYLFCGSRGVGKTTLARLFAKALNCKERGADGEPCNRCTSCIEIGTAQSLDVIEIDGASNRGIDDVRQITETAYYTPMHGCYKIYIIDEVHMLTKEAFNALLKTLEEPPERAKFLFATTEPHKVLPTIVSRCQRFDLSRIPVHQMSSKLEQIGRECGRTIESEGLYLIASFADGSLRDAESLLDQLFCFAEGTVTGDAVRKILGLVPREQLFALDQAFSSAEVPFAFHLVHRLFVTGVDFAHFLTQLIEHVRLLAMVRICGEKEISFLPENVAACYMQSARLYAPSQCLYLLDYLLRMEPQFQKSSCQRVSLEAILLHYIQSKHRIPVEVLVRRLSELEQAVHAAGAQSTVQGVEEKKRSSALPQMLSSDPVHVLSRDKDVEHTGVLQPVPFQPFSKEEKTQIAHPDTSRLESAGATIVPAPLDTDVKNSCVGIEEAAVSSAALSQTLAPDLKDKAHYDTLMRFAAVELEGTLQLYRT